MKTKLMTLALSTIVATSTVASEETRILHIASPDSALDSFEVLTNNREALKVSPNNTELVDKLFEAKELNSIVEFESSDSNLTSLKVLEQGDADSNLYPENEELHPMTNYSASNVSSLELAQEMFSDLKDGGRWFSQCYNRAHVWAKQMYDKYDTKSMKILIYYTKKFRQEIGGKWWFHIAPMINVEGQRYVMDREFTRGPVTDEKWEQIFTKKMAEKGITGYRCKVIKNIKEYYDEYNQNNEYCNIQVTSMYYWEPNDMSRLDKTGEQKTEFLNWELKRAAKNMFWKWKKQYKRIKVTEKI